MALISVTQIPTEISAGTTVDNQLSFSSMADQRQLNAEINYAAIELITGGPILFKVGGNPDASSASLSTANPKIVLPFGPKGLDIFFKQTANGDKFRLSLC